jgi:hypothetical protein
LTPLSAPFAPVQPKGCSADDQTQAHQATDNATRDCARMALTASKSLGPSTEMKVKLGVEEPVVEVEVAVLDK